MELELLVRPAQPLILNESITTTHRKLGFKLSHLAHTDTSIGYPVKFSSTANRLCICIAPYPRVQPSSPSIEAITSVSVIASPIVSSICTIGRPKNHLQNRICIDSSPRSNLFAAITSHCGRFLNQSPPQQLWPSRKI